MMFLCESLARLQRRQKNAYGDIVRRHVETVRSTSSPILYTLRPQKKEAGEYNFFCIYQQVATVELYILPVLHICGTSLHIHESTFHSP